MSNALLQPASDQRRRSGVGAASGQRTWAAQRKTGGWSFSGRNDDIPVETRALSAYTWYVRKIS